MIAVIGDIHGCYFTLKYLVEKIRFKFPNVNIYCVGDLVDRGNNSFEVVEFIKKEKILFTIGNHDYMFYSNMRDPFSVMAKSWNYNGAETTINSYKDKLKLMDDHLDFIIHAPLFYNTEDCFISHAGISEIYKGKIDQSVLSEIEKLETIFQENLFDRESIIWNRGPILNIKKLQVVGHTHRKEIHFDEKANAVYIDTTAYGNNKLSALIIENSIVIETIEQKTILDDVNSNWIYQF